MVTATFTDSHQQALELDLWILSSTLSHGRSSHQRTIHFQRLQMAKTCFCRHRLDALANDWQDFSVVWRNHYSQQSQSGISKRKSVKGHQEIGGCSSIVGATDTGRKNNDDDVGENGDAGAAQRRLRSQVKDLQDRLLSGSNEFYSRAFHASEAGMTEIGRGHFLPFLIVTFAALARLRALLLRLQTKVKLVDIPAMLQTMDSVGKNNGVDTASIQSLRAALVLLRDSIVLVSDPRTDVDSAASASLQEAERHVQLLANLGITRATEKLQKGRAQTQLTNHTPNGNVTTTTMILGIR
jgi:hypothetical protein